MHFFLLSAGLLIDVNYILVKQLTQKENLQTARAGSKGEKRKESEKKEAEAEDDKLLGLHSGNNVSKTETEWLQKGKKNK